MPVPQAPPSLCAQGVYRLCQISHLFVDGSGQLAFALQVGERGCALLWLSGAR